MSQRILLILLPLLFVGCLAAPQKKKPQEPAPTEKPLKMNAADDLAFAAFLERLREAVRQHDVPLLASMMSPSFGWRWDEVPPGENVFDYWDRNNTWPELELILREKFVPKGPFMVAPPQFAADPDNYRGYRAGIRMENGTWRFAYFVPDPT